jgi:DNA-binding transcriptional LysR family regulator
LEWNKTTPMDRLNAMTAFIRCVERGSFSAVARELDTTQPTVSKLIASLERHLGGKLFSRSTRDLALTAEGQRFYEQCRGIVDAVRNAEASFRSGREEVAGTLRAATSVSFGRTQVMPRLRLFMRRHPLLRVDLQLNDRFVDLVEEGIDVAFRIGELTDDNLIARRIGTTNRVTVATTEYLKRHGEPRHPDELKQHDCIQYTGLATRNEWPYVRDGRSCPVRVSGSFQSNSAEAVRAAALDGIGIAFAPLWLFGDDIRARRIRAILVDYRPKPLPIHAVSPTVRRHSAKIKAWVDYFHAAFDADPFVSAHRPP